MKKTLIAATPLEIAPTVAFLEHQSMRVSDQWEVVITGIGSMLTAYSLTRHVLQARPALIIQAGIAGSFTADCPPGSVVMVEEEKLGDLGVEERGAFKDVFEMGFLNSHEPPFTFAGLKNVNGWESLGLPRVTGLTVNEVSTGQQRIQQLKDKYSCEIETMEGAAFHYVCLKENIPFLQLRAISNFVGERDKNNWQLRHSVERLNQTLQQLINTL